MNTARQLVPNPNWFDVPDPNSPDLDELAGRFHLHELQIEDSRHRPQRAKADEYGTYLFVVLKHLVRNDHRLEFDDFDVFLGPDLRNSRSAAGDYHGFLRHEPASTLEQQLARCVVRQHNYGAFDCGGTLASFF